MNLVSSYFIFVENLQCVHSACFVRSDRNDYSTDPGHIWPLVDRGKCIWEAELSFQFNFKSIVSSHSKTYVEMGLSKLGKAWVIWNVYNFSNE